MDPDGWLFVLDPISDHHRVTLSYVPLISFIFIPVVCDRHRELVIVVLCEQVCLFLVEELKTLLSVAKKNVLGVDHDLVTGPGVFYVNIDRTNSLLGII